MYIGIFVACMSTQHVHVVPLEARRVLESLELDLHMDASFHVNAENTTQAKQCLTA